MRTRLLLAMVGVVALVLAVHDIPLAGHLESVERDRLTTTLERDAFIIAGRVEEALEEGSVADDTGVQALVDRYAVEEDVRVVIVDRDATAVAGSDDTAIGEDFSNREEITTALSDGNPSTGARYSNTLGTDLFFVAVPVLSGDDVAGAIRLSAPEQVVTDRASSRVRGLLGIALISLAIAVFVAWLLARGVTRPLRRLEAATSQLAQGDLSARAPDDDGPPEIRALAASFNSMASRTEQLIARQRDFAGTASHQLRTPLTALRLRLEQLGASGGGDRDTVDAAIAETDRLSRTIEGLLVLSRAEDTAAAAEPVDLAGAAAARVDHWRPLADERDVRLARRGADRAMVVAVPGAVEEIIDNLVDNALEVSPAGSTLTIEVLPSAHHTELHVIDEGPGLDDSERERAFERFWRGSGAPAGGSGLGLAIVRQLVLASDGTVELCQAGSGGIDAVVRLRTAKVSTPPDRPSGRALHAR